MKSLETFFYMQGRLVFVTSLLAVSGPMANAAGTVAFANGSIVNGTLVPMQWYPGNSGSTVPLPTSVQVVYGVFWGTNRNAMTLVLPLGSSSLTTAGRINAPSVYQIPGTEAGQKVYLQVKGWSAAYGTNWMKAWSNNQYFSRTSVNEVTLGSETGPGTVIWQSDLGTDPNKFHPLTFGVPLTPPLFVTFGFQPNPSVVVDEGSQGVVDATLTVNRFANGPASNLDFTTAVLLSTADMTAVAGQDYIPTNILVTFGPGETVRQVGVKVMGDALQEPDEQFSVSLFPTSSVMATLYNPIVVTIREARVVSVRREENAALVTIRTTGIQRYALESSMDMESWSTVLGAESIAGTGGLVEVVDLSQDHYAARFYRARLLP